MIISIGALISCSQQKQPRYLHLNMFSEPLTLDPRKASDLSSSSLLFLINEGLTKIGQDASHQLGLAEKIEVSEDGCTYTFFLKEAFWTDGASITAEDFIASWKATLAPSFPSANAYLLFPILNAKKIKEGLLPPESLGVFSPDPKILSVTLEKPIPYFLELTSFTTYFPIPSHIDPLLFDKETIPTSGPFRIYEWKRKNLLTLTANPLFHSKEKIQLEGITITFIESEETTAHLFEMGEIDFIGCGFSSFSLEAIEQLKKEHVTHQTHIPAVTFLSFRLTHPLFQHPNIRKAFSLAIDRKSIAEHILQSKDLAAYRILPPSLQIDTTPSEALEYDRNQARLLFEGALAELSPTADQMSIEFIVKKGGHNASVAQYLVESWRSTFNIEISLRFVDQKTHLDALQNQRYDISLGFMYAQYHHPENILERFTDSHLLKNYPQWENRSYTTAITQGNYQKGEEILLKELPIAPLYFHSSNFAFSPKLADIYISESGSVDLSRAYFCD